MKKILAVYNSCGISGQENIVYYVDAIRSLLYQTMMDGGEMKIALSACRASNMWKIQSENTFHDLISYNFIEDNVPVSVTFNDTVDKCVKHFGEFDGYLYIDSGISFWDPSCRFNALDMLYTAHKSGPNALTAAMPSNDDGRQWWGIEYKPGEDFVFPVGKTTNLHCQIFDNEWRKAYGRVLPDIFASHCMESVFSHMSAAIKKKFLMTQKVHVLHNHSMDGASIGTRIGQEPDRFPMSDMFETGGLLFKTRKTMDERYREGVELGFGFEECKEYWRHRPECFDSDGYATNPELAPFYAREVFLKPGEFDYNSLRSHFVPSR